MEYKTFFKFDPGTAHLRRKRLIDHSFISSSPKKGAINTVFLHFPLDLFFEGIFTHTYRVFRKNCVFSQFTATYSPASRKATQPRKRYQCTFTPIGCTFSVQPIAGNGKVAIFRKFLKKKSEQCVSWQTTVYYYYIYLTCMQQFRSRSVHRDLLHSQPLL